MIHSTPLGGQGVQRFAVQLIKLMDVSVMICTRNRASFLKDTLQSLKQLNVPPSLHVELLVVDNGSTDHTPDVVQQFHSGPVNLRLCRETTPGLSNARNTGLRNASGSTLLFTDDDVRVPRNWIVDMTAPIRSGEADAVAGGVRLAPHLRRPWIKRLNTGVLAETSGLDPHSPRRMVGANMAFGRHVLDTIPLFDPDLGAGALGAGEETFFSMQLREAGYTIQSALDVVVEHHCAPERLTRDALQRSWEKVGRARGYIQYHWRHSEKQFEGLDCWLSRKKLWLALQWERLKYALTSYDSLPISPHESYLIEEYYRRRQIQEEAGRPRNYSRHGFIKRDTASK